jgi:hypothetical protein
MVWSATAIPVEWRTPSHLGVMDFQFVPDDVILNVLGYTPVGIVLGNLGVLGAVLAAGVMAVAAEYSQFVMMHRDPSVVDVVSNALGAFVGALAAKRLGSPRIPVDRRTGLIAAVLFTLLFVRVSVTAAPALNPRGVAEPGSCEGHWTFDGDSTVVITDSSGHGLDGRIRGAPTRTSGVLGSAIKLNGPADYIELGTPSALRMTGSLTVTAWMKAVAYPSDDAAIVSNLRHTGDGYDVGFQLDATADTGPRTVGFKLADSCGALMARYGSSDLNVDSWYHVAGVYDAAAQAMNVYLNGRLDNGRLLGTVGSTHKVSRASAYIGRRPDSGRFPFSGFLDDVRIYSRALTQEEVAAVMHGKDIVAGQPHSTALGTVNETMGGDSQLPARACTWSSEYEDARLPGSVATLGVLACTACLGLWPSCPRAVCLVIAASVGWLTLSAASSTLPALNMWTFPLTSIAGTCSVMWSTTNGSTEDH